MDYSDCYCEDAYGYVYITWINNPASEFDKCYYVGQRLISRDRLFKGKIYYGSGKKIHNYQQKWGDFGLNRMIINYADDQEELNYLEESLVGDDYLNKENCLNLRAGGNQKGFSEESRQKLRDANLGKARPEEVKLKISNKLRGYKWSLERNQKISETMKNKPKGRHYYNNGKIEVLRYDCPSGFTPGKLKQHRNPTMLGKKHSKETRIKMSNWQSKNNPMRGKIWINNGINAYVIDVGKPIPDGFVKGRGHINLTKGDKLL